MPADCLQLRYCTPLNIPIVFTNHTRYDLYSQAYLPFVPKTISEAGLKTYMSPFFRACDLVIIPSESLYHLLIDQFSFVSSCVVIPNGIDLEPFYKEIKPLDRQILGFSNDDIIAIFVGRIAPEKNLTFLLSSFQMAA